jgi:hypothetical protein
MQKDYTTVTTFVRDKYSILDIITALYIYNLTFFVICIEQFVPFCVISSFTPPKFLYVIFNHVLGMRILFSMQMYCDMITVSVAR